MIATKFDSILPVFDLDLNQVAASVRGKSDPLSRPREGNPGQCPSLIRRSISFRYFSDSSGLSLRRPDLP